MPDHACPTCAVMKRPSSEHTFTKAASGWGEQWLVDYMENVAGQWIWHQSTPTHSEPQARNLFMGMVAGMDSGEYQIRNLRLMRRWVGAWDEVEHA